MSINSLHARYILSALVLLVLILLVIGWSSYSINSNSESSLNNANNRRIVQLSSSRIRDNVWEIDFYINAYKLEPSTENRLKTLDGLQNLKANINQLSSNPWSENRNREQLIRQLYKNAEAMENIVHKLIEIRENQDIRFPSLSIIRNKLYPANLEFITLTSLILEEMRLEYLTSDDAEFYRLLADTQRIWHRMIGSFRLFVAYRSESISNPVQGMSNELNNINTLYEGVMSNLRQLSELNRNDLPGTKDNETIDELTYIAENWHDNFEAVSKIHSSGEWRLDDAFIRQQVYPLSQHIRELLYQLDEETDLSSKEDIQSLTLLAESITSQIWILGIILLTLITAGYFYLQNRILRPISDVAEGLLEESKEHKNVHLPENSTREVNALLSAFNQLSESLAEAEAVVRHTDKMSVVGELASGVAHEINNPLNNIARLIEFIEDAAITDDTDESLQEDFKILHHEIDRCAGIVKGLLDFGRPANPQTRPVFLSEIIDDSTRLLRYQAQGKQLNIKTCFPENEKPVSADPSQIHQVVVNLLLNAISFSPANSTILIELEYTTDNPSNLQCRVIDNGPGATESEIARFFDPFYTTRAGNEGSGLGLSVCYGIIMHHHGEIGAHAGERSGLVVWFTLPVITEND